MDVVFPEVGFSQREKSEIDEVFYRISIGNQSGEWRGWPDAIRVLKRLTGGRSGSQVLEVVVKRGNHEARKVIKLGPGYDLENEFKAFDTYLRSANALFVRIEAATPVALGKTRARRGELEAVVYDHAARFIGAPQHQTRTFEEIALEAIQQGGPGLEKAIRVLETLFDGIHNDLYDKYQVSEQETTLQKSWNRKLGIDAVVAIDRVDPASKTLETSYRPIYGAAQARLRPRDIADASVRIDGKAAKGDVVQVHGTRMTWQGDRLVAQEDAHYLRIEILPDNMPVSQLASMIEEGSEWMLRGQLVSLRMESHLERLLGGLGSDFTLADGKLTGPGARVRDPFAALPAIIESHQVHRITSVVHGDLNPRNILVINESSCLIDYALTRGDEPILMDFTRLEGLLTRDALPADMSWAQHVRLQRLLAAACRLGDEAARRFAERLAADQAELVAAFRLLWTIRRAARDVYPKQYQEQWARDYLEQLFLFAHLTLKWGEEEELVPRKLRATAAMAGVSAEALSNTDIYDLWSVEALREDSAEIIQLLRSRPEACLRELANLARVWPRLDAKQDAALQDAFEGAREGLVKGQFRAAAHAAISRLNDDHDVYISLKAYIDLKGQLRAGYRRQRYPLRRPPEGDELLSFDRILRADELLAESEFLPERSGTSKDVVSLLVGNPVAVLIGDAGSGKSTVAREWEYCLAHSIVEHDRNVTGFAGDNLLDGLPPLEQAIQHRSSETRGSPLAAIKPRMPIVLRAPDLSEHLQNWDGRNLQSTISALRHDERDRDLLTIGALYIIVDALNELADEQKKRVASWIIALRDAFPNTPILVCHRQYNYVSGMLPFPVIKLQKVETEQARRYIYDYLREKDVPNHELLAQRLVALLLDDPDYVPVRDLAQTPLFLWMIVEHYKDTGEVPQSRGGLFETFSRWYLEQRYHKAHREMTSTRYGYEDKALLLGALGYELVQRHETTLPAEDVPQFIPRSIKKHWREIVEEIIAAEMLSQEGKHLRFLHQSFQEYFAARHFLKTEANDPVTIRQKILQFGWHDTFAMLLGFAGDAPQVVTQVIEEALKVNPILTARCLRMAEQPDARLLENFVARQEATLKSAQSGTFSYERAAQALAEYGRDQARAALWHVTDAADAPEAARVEALKRLAAMPAQVRFEPIAERIRQEFVSHLPHIFDEPAPVAVRQTAIDAIVTTALKDLGAYLVDLVESGEWTLRWVAWQACNQLGFKLTRGQQAAFVRACRERLDKTEEELFQEIADIRINALNAERINILQQLATPANLPQLLKRRFSFGIADEVGEILNQMDLEHGEPPIEARDAWRILTEQPGDDANAIDHWLELLHGQDGLTALAAAHRLVKFGEELPGEKLNPFLDPGLPPEMLSAVAHLVRACQDESLVKPLEGLMRSLLEIIIDTRQIESFANLVEALNSLDSHVGNRMAAVATTNFLDNSKEIVYGYFPWRVVAIEIQLDNKDYQVLFAAGRNDARAAVFNLGIHGAGTLIEAAKSEHPNILDDISMQQLQDLAESEQDPQRQSRFARAAVNVHAVGLLPWLINLTHSPEMAKSQVTVYYNRYGAYKFLRLSDILCSIGYLARVLLDKELADQARPAVAFLRDRYTSLQPDEERTIVVGLVTGLGYLGDWEPILTHLGHGEPWMQKAAENVFKYWVPTPLNSASEEKQREEASVWIAHRLHDRLDLAPQARSTLELIKDRLDTQLGRHIGV